MHSGKRRLVIFVIVLILANLACGGGTGATKAPPATATPAASPTPAVKLGEVQRSEEYGFSFRPIPGYKLDTSFGAQMLAPEADPDTGPAFMLAGGEAAEGTTAETLIASLKSDEIELSEPKPITVDGVSGLAAELTRSKGDLSGRIVAVMVTPGQQFILFAMAPQAQWDEEVATLFDAVLGSVKFIEVTAAASPTEIGAEPTVAPKSTKAAAARPTPTKAAATSETGMVEERHSDEGGFTFLVIPDYEVTDEGGQVQMLAPDGDPDLGPVVMLMAREVEKGTTAEGTVAELESKDVILSETRPITIGGAEGVVADITREQGDVLGQVAVVMVTPTRQFVLLGGAPKARWQSELAGSIQTLLDTITFFEPLGGPDTSGELRQWAASATASSAFGTTNWAATQATGKPDVSTCTDDGAAWASAGKNTVEWLELTYTASVIPSMVNIYQTYNPGQVVKVELLDTSGKYHSVYTAKPKAAETCPGVLNIPIADADYSVVGVKITVDQTVLKNWGEIDAVELVGMGADGSNYDPTETELDSKTGLPVMEGATDKYATDTTLNYTVKASLADARAFYLAELPKISWLLDLDDKGKCRDNDRCMGWHGGYDDPATTTFFFLQGEHAYLTLNFVEAKGSLNVILGIDPNYKK
jgi:hypothetical protein